MNARDVDVVVAGAGLAGLSAARSLAAAGASVAVLEARDRVGGRTYSVPVGDAVFDLGGQYLGMRQQRIARLASELGLEARPTPCEGTKWIEIEGRRASYTTAPSLAPLALLQLQLVIRQLGRAMRDVDAAEPWRSPRAAAFDAHTLESWYRRFTVGGTSRALIANAIRAVFGIEPGEFSLLSALQYVKGAGGLAYMMATPGGSQERYLVAGSQELSKRIAAALGERVVLNAPVRRIAHGPEGALVESNAGTWRARRVVVAMPPLLAGAIAYDPRLPATRTALTDRFPMGAAIKFIALYERTFWRARGFSGEIFSDRGPLLVTLDGTKKDGGQPALVAFIEGAKAREWSARPAAERRAALLADLASFYGPEAERPTHVLEQDWVAEPWTRGCSAGFTPPGVLARFGPALRAPIGPLHWAGTETAREWFGYMEGAIESGERAAEEVLALARA